MPKQRSAGILIFKGAGATLQVLLVHPGGPFWRKKDLGAWSIPKGELADDEPIADAALRECEEELGFRPTGVLRDLGDVRQKGGKLVTAFAVAGDFDVSLLRSNEFALEWPPRSGRTVMCPEVDRAEWMPMPIAREKILGGQLPFLDRLEEMLKRPT